MPSAGNDENKVLHLTGSATINASSLLNESITARAVVSHPLKSNLTTTNQTIDCRKNVGETIDTLPHLSINI